MPPENSPKTKEIIWRKPLLVFARISSWIVFPIVAALLFGKWLDAKFNTDQLMFLICGGVAVLVTILGIWLEMRKYIKDLKEEENKNDNGTRKQ